MVHGITEEPEIEAWLERRRALGHDGRDEVWEGVYQVVPHASTRHARIAGQVIIVLEPFARAAGLWSGGEFNLGEDEKNFRVPDGGWFDALEDALFARTASVVLEVLSPGDKTFEKFDFYARHGVHEILVADPDARTVRCWLVLPGANLTQAPASTVLGISMDELTAAIRWD